MWTPLYPAAKFIRPIRENIESLLKANEAESLAWANDGDAMPAYKVYRKALWYNTLWPVISIVSQSTEMEGAGDEALPQTHVFLVEIEDSGPNPDDLVSTVERRVQAVSMIIETASLDVFKTGMDANRVAIKQSWVASHKYAQFERGQNFYLQAADLIVKVQTIER